MLISVLSLVVVPFAVGYLFSLREDQKNHAHFLRVTQSQ